MFLDERHLKPFDRTYANVTRRITGEAETLSPPSSTWLLRLVDSFAQERLYWNTRSELAAYRIAWLNFRSKLLRLVAGAYLHISYDLPRALADDWPGTGAWKAGPQIAEGRAVYFRLRNIFPEVLLQSAREFRTTGAPAILARGMSKRAVTSAAIWVENLRQGAWIHAEILATSPDRSYREGKMAEAITAATQDASLWHPWSVLHLRPPYDAFYNPVWTTVLAGFPLFLEVTNAVALIIATAWVTSQLTRSRFRLRATASFIDVWGYLISDYVAYAVREPEGFDQYRDRRRTEIALAPIPKAFRT